MNNPVFAFTGKSGWKPTNRFLDRIFSMYALTSTTYVQPDGSVWSEIGQRKKDIHAVLIGGKRADLYKILANPADNDLYYGMESLCKTFVSSIQDTDKSKRFIEQNVSDNFSIVASHSGAHRLRNNETTQDAEFAEPEATLLALDQHLGANIRFPNPFPLEYGMVTSRGIIGHRTAYALYHAIKCRELCLLIGYRILEIGAGMGRTAFFCHSMGLQDYTIVDLPLTLVGQAAFLSATLGEDAVWLEGENSADAAGRIKLRSPEGLLQSGADFDVALNIDSMTEMSLDQGIAYFHYLAKHACALYAMNHEANPYRTLDMASAAGVSVSPLRHHSVLRPGYVEETYFFVPFSSATSPRSS